MPYDQLIAAFELPGSPSGFGEPGGNPYEWRERCRDCAKHALCGVDLPITRPVKLVVRFAVLHQARGHDLDNLLKPLIDALGAAGLFAPSTGGGKASDN